MFPKMTDHTSRIKPKQQILQSKLSRLCLKTLMMGLWVFAASISSVQTATCSSSVPASAATTTEKYTFDLYFCDLECSFIFRSILRSFPGYGYIYTYGVAGGPVSNSLYFLYSLQSLKKRCDLNLDIKHIQCAQNKRTIKYQVIKRKFYLIAQIY